MKKVLLGLLCFTGIGAVAQTYTVDDTLSSGMSQIYYSADSAATNLDAINGTGVTWDYSGLQAYSSAGQILDTIRNAADSPDFASFSDATYHDDLNNNSGGDYFKNFPDSVVSYGYTFSVDGNPVQIMNNADPLKIIEFPMNQGDSFTDSIYGEVDVYSQIFDSYGAATITADGSGTLILGDSTFTNVLRIKMVETLQIDTTFIGFPINADVGGEVTRTMYSYYDFANYDFPLLRHASIAVSTNLFSGSFAAVYSIVELDLLDASFGEESIQPISIYPNPSNDFIIVQSTDVEQLIVVNSLGQTVTTIVNPQASENINVSQLESGIYFVQVKKGNAIRTEKFTVK
jgi:hypothetical protein